MRRRNRESRRRGTKHSQHENRHIRRPFYAPEPKIGAAFRRGLFLPVKNHRASRQRLKPQLRFATVLQRRVCSCRFSLSSLETKWKTATKAARQRGVRRDNRQRHGNTRTHARTHTQLTSSKLLDMRSDRSGLMTLRAGAGASPSSSRVRDVSTETQHEQRGSFSNVRKTFGSGDSPSLAPGETKKFCDTLVDQAAELKVCQIAEPRHLSLQTRVTTVENKSTARLVCVEHWRHRHGSTQLHKIVFILTKSISRQTSLWVGSSLCAGNWISQPQIVQVNKNSRTPDRNGLFGGGSLLATAAF